MHRYVRTCFTDLFEKTLMSRNRPMHLECLSFKPPLCHLLLRCKSSGNPRPPNEPSIPVRKARAQLFNRKGDMSTTIPLAPVETLHTAIFATWTNPSTAESSCNQIQPRDSNSFSDLTAKASALMESEMLNLSRGAGILSGVESNFATGPTCMYIYLYIYIYLSKYICIYMLSERAIYLFIYIYMYIYVYIYIFVIYLHLHLSQPGNFFCVDACVDFWSL